MTWTNIAKPTGANYTNVNVQGKEQYDQASIMYDDPNVFYDGINDAAWTDISKPVFSGATWDQVVTIWNNEVSTWDSPQNWNIVTKPS